MAPHHKGERIRIHLSSTLFSVTLLSSHYWRTSSNKYPQGPCVNYSAISSFHHLVGCSATGREGQAERHHLPRWVAEAQNENRGSPGLHTFDASLLWTLGSTWQKEGIGSGSLNFRPQSPLHFATFWLSGDTSDLSMWWLSGLHEYSQHQNFEGCYGRGEKT